MIIRTLQVGEAMTNCYVVVDAETMDCVVIDPGDEAELINDYLDQEKLSCKYIIATHGHSDHVGALGAVANHTGATFCMNLRPLSQRMAERGETLQLSIPSIDLHEGDKLTCGSMVFSVLETPGHTDDGICLICEDAIFTGDTLLRGNCGAAPNIPGTDYNVIKKSLLKLYELPGEYDVFPGHMVPTKLEYERRTNVYMRDAYSLRVMEDLKK